MVFWVILRGVSPWGKGVFCGECPHRKGGGIWLEYGNWGGGIYL